MTTEEILMQLAQQDADIAKELNHLTQIVNQLLKRLEDYESRKDNHRLTTTQV